PPGSRTPTPPRRTKTPSTGPTPRKPSPASHPRHTCPSRRRGTTNSTPPPHPRHSPDAPVTEATRSNTPPNILLWFPGRPPPPRNHRKRVSHRTWSSRNRRTKVSSTSPPPVTPSRTRPKHRPCPPRYEPHRKPSRNRKRRTTPDRKKKATPNRTRHRTRPTSPPSHPGTPPRRTATNQASWPTTCHRCGPHPRRKLPHPLPNRPPQRPLRSTTTQGRRFAQRFTAWTALPLPRRRTTETAMGPGRGRRALRFPRSRNCPHKERNHRKGPRHVLPRLPGNSCASVP